VLETTVQTSFARGRLAEGSLDHAAHARGTGKRTLARRMHSVLSKSPLAFFQDLRIDLTSVAARNALGLMPQR
jgi:hypothetical protein